MPTAGTAIATVQLSSFNFQQYIFFLLLVVVKKSKLFSLNKDLHSINTRQRSNFHQPSAHLKKYQVGPYCMGINLFNILPASIKDESHNPPRFRSLLKKIFIGDKIVFVGGVLQYP
jgi:hypothetical protein